MLRRLSVVVLCVAGCMPSLSAATDVESLSAYTGEQLFARFCASCHGDKAYGDGPVAPALKVMVPDLSRVSARNGGRFPEERIRRVVDGRAMLPAHGNRFMPVWGYEFEAQAGADEPGRASAQRLIDRLVEYLRTIQQ